MIMNVSDRSDGDLSGCGFCEDMQQTAIAIDVAERQLLR